MPSIGERVEGLDWEVIAHALDERGYATISSLLTVEECTHLIDLYSDATQFRSRVDMGRHRFGVGEYKYFAEPLPQIVVALRMHLFAQLSPIANRWMDVLRIAERFPRTLTLFLDRCAEHGQKRPTPLLLHYTTGGYNCLHQDLYGTVAFPLQFTCVLSQRDQDYDGGELLLVEQRPRAQSRGEVIALDRGAGVIFPTRYRPVAGVRGSYRATVRHGLSRLHAGERFALGIIFHNAE